MPGLAFLSRFFLSIERVTARFYFIHQCLCRAFNYCVERLFDWYFGIETRKLESLQEEESRNLPGSNCYTPTPWFGLIKLLSLLPKQPTAAFLDLGCGKGRALLVAGRFSFKRIVGVELSSALCEIAKKNISVVKAKCPIEVLNQNAVQYQIPHDVGVCLLFNPFNLDITLQVAKNISLSLKSHPRDFYLIYVDPEYVYTLQSVLTLAEPVAVPQAFGGFYRIFKVTG